MQPPPRKVKPSVSLKNIQIDQVTKLNVKHQQECDLLEDIRAFFSRKAALEKEYAQGLLKATSQLLKREFPAQPDLNSENGQEHKTVTAVWRAILEESDKLARVRLQASEVYSDKVAEPLKPAKVAKVQIFKKVMPQLSVIHSEVGQCVMELVKTQKTYMAEASFANEARQKSLDAEDKLKRKSTGIFQSLASLQKSCAKLRARTEANEIKETSARNEYLLALAAANAHQIRYYSTDLPEIMKTLDCDIYEKIQESLTLAGQTAADIADNEATFFHSIAVEAAKICREFSQQCYLFQNSVFTNLVQYQFESCPGDMCNKLSGDHNASSDLEKEARKWSTRVAKETRAIRDYYRQITLLNSQKTGDKPAEPGSQDAGVVTDSEAKLEELKQGIRKAETTKLKAEARLEALRLGGVNVDDWINQAQMESLVAEESGLTRTPSQISLRTESSGGQSTTDDHEATYTHYDDDDDFIDDTFNISGHRSGRAYPIMCKALYDFQASNYDEMSINTGETLELVGDGDGEGWVKAKNSIGVEGYIPETYVDYGQPKSAGPGDVEAINTVYDSHGDMAKFMTSSLPQGQQQPAAQSTATDLPSPTSGDLQQDTTSSYSSGDLEVQQTTEVMTSGRPCLPSTILSGSEALWARALFDYEAQTEEELSFLEGAIIRILRKDDHGVEDGFWEGECNGQMGVFPSLVVEELGGSPEDLFSPGSLSTQTDFSVPPPVQITLPTPENEPPSPPVTVNRKDSQSVQTPTAENQPSKRVRFKHQGQAQPSLRQRLDSHRQFQRQQQQQQHVKIPQLSFIPDKHDLKPTHSQKTTDSTHLQILSPILRHISLPSCLNIPEPEQAKSDRTQSDTKATLFLSNLRGHQKWSHSQPQLVLSLGMPPSSRRHRVLLQQTFEKHPSPLKNYPSKALNVNSSLPELDQTLADGHRILNLFKTQSYSNSPFVSPQLEHGASILQGSDPSLYLGVHQRQPDYLQLSSDTSSDHQNQPGEANAVQSFTPDPYCQHSSSLTPSSLAYRKNLACSPSQPCAKDLDSQPSTTTSVDQQCPVSHMQLRGSYTGPSPPWPDFLQQHYSEYLIQNRKDLSPQCHIYFPGRLSSTHCLQSSQLTVNSQHAGYCKISQDEMGSDEGEESLV